MIKVLKLGDIHGDFGWLRKAVKNKNIGNESKITYIIAI